MNYWNLRAGCLVLALAALACTACTGRGEAKATGPSGHERMLELLRGIRERTPDENRFLGDKAVRTLAEQLAALPADAGDERKWKLNYDLGQAELRVGHESAAIEHLSAAYELLPRFHGELGQAREINTRYRLAIAYLRLGETQNCCQRESPESCIMPIRGGGVHDRQEGSRQAARLFGEVLERGKAGSSTYLRARWLLNIAHMTLGSWPDGVSEPYRIAPAVLASEQEFPRFPNVAARVGLDTFDLSGGAILDDFDNDGYLDVVTSSIDSSERLHLYHNQRDGTFVERGEAAHFAGLFGGLNIVQADYDNDGWTDIVVLRGAWWGAWGRQPHSLLHNNGDGTFTDVTFDAGMGEGFFPTQTGNWADYDNDGDLDLYIGHEQAPAVLFRNDGGGRFTNVAREAGVENMRFAKGVVWGDYDGDRYPDIYISNLDGANRLYHNNRNGTFTDVAEQLGVTLPLGSFPCWFWDFDNDGALDIYVATYRGKIGVAASVAASYLGLPFDEEPARLYRGDGRGGFEEVAAARNLKRYTVAMGANFGDLDNDGWLDFYLGTGYPDYEGLIPNVMYRNDAGRRFLDVTTAAGFGHLQKGHGVAFGDLDNDGDQDVFEQMGGGIPGDKYGDVLFENPGFGNHWITIRLVGTRSNRSAIGARLRVDVVEDGRPRTIYRWVTSGGSFGASPLRQSIGLGRAERIARLEIWWPTTGERQVFEDVVADRFVEIVEGQDVIRPFSLERLTLGGAAAR